MTDRPTAGASVVAGHLDEAALEAAASDLEELLSEAQLNHLDECERCAEWVAITREDITDASVALRRAMPQIDGLDRMIAAAMEAAPDPEWLANAPTRRSLIVGGTIGALLATGLAIGSGPGAALSGIGALGRQGWTLLHASDHVVGSMVPGGWASVAMAGLLLAMLLALPVRLLLGRRDLRIPGLTTLGGMLTVLLVGAVTLTTGEARAYRLDGEWPSPEPTVSVSVEGQPTSVALRQAATSANLGIMLRLEDDPPVTLHVTDAPISEVMEALLGDSDVLVRPSPHLLSVVRDEAPPDLAPRAPPATTQPARPVVVAIGPGVTPVPSVPSTPSLPSSIPSPPAGISDRISFGGDLVVREDEQVREVVTAGGDADIRGRAFGNVVTAGGDATIRGEVIGNVTSAGGDIAVLEGAIVHGDLNAMGGDVDVHDSAMVHGQILGDRSRIHAGARAADVSDGGSGIVRWALLNVLVFLLGLVMLGSARKRLVTLRAELASRPFRSALSGIFGLPAGIVLAVVLLLTIIGSPASVILATVLFMAFWVGWATAAWWIGTALPLRFLNDRPVMQLAAGVLTLFIIGLVPKVGGLMAFVAIMAGLGAVIATSFGKKTKTKKRKHVATGPFASAP